MENNEVKIFTDLSNEDYHNADGISNTAIGLINKCPRLYEYQYIEGNREQDIKGARHLGSAIHTIILEPHTFTTRYHILPEGLDRRTKEGKHIYEMALHTNKILLKHEDALIVFGIRDSIEKLEVWKKLREKGGKVENSIFWKHDDVVLKCRPDWHNDYLSIDIKSTESADPADFVWSIKKNRYHRQGAMILDGLTKAYNKKYDSHVILAIEKEPPYLSNLFLLDDRDIDEGREEYLRGAQTYKQCKAANYWPSYPDADKIKLISIPRTL